VRLKIEMGEPPWATFTRMLYATLIRRLEI